MNRREKLQKRISSVFSINKIIPSAITLTALCFGLSSIRYGMLQQLDMAVLCILFAAFFDAMDGRAARFLGSSSQFGAELDSLSDLVCFGVAPGMLVYTVSTPPLGKLTWLVCLYYVVCCALRLARFNVGQINDAHAITEEKTPPELKVFFTGIPAPAGAIMCVLPVVYSLCFSTRSSLCSCYIILAALLAGTLMISKIHTFSSKMIRFDQGNSVVTLIAIMFVIMSLIVETWLAILCLTLLYIALIPFGDIEYKRRLNNIEMKRKN